MTTIFSLHQSLINRLFILVFSLFASQAFAQESAANAKTDEEKTAAAKTQVIFETSLGNFTIELNREKAPATVENFLQYVNDGFYQDTIFHRVIDGFMVQGGGFTEDMVQKQTRTPVKNEADNGLTNIPGSVAMARTNAPHSATSQFFVNVVDNTFLNHRSKTTAGWGYTVFGQVTEGMEVIDAIRLVPTTTKTYYQNVPIKPVVINKAYVKD